MSASPIPTIAAPSSCATPRGREAFGIAVEAIAEMEARWTDRLGEARMRRLRGLLEDLNADL